MVLVATAQLAIAFPQMGTTALSAHESGGAVNWEATATALKQLQFPAHVVEAGVKALKKVVAESEQESVYSAATKIVWKTKECKAASKDFSKVRLAWQQNHNLNVENESSNIARFMEMSEKWNKMMECAVDDEDGGKTISWETDECKDASKAFAKVKGEWQKLHNAKGETETKYMKDFQKMGTKWGEMMECAVDAPKP